MWKCEYGSFNWWFECKSHRLNKRRQDLGKKEFSDKIIDTLLNENPPDCYVIISKNLQKCSWTRDTLPKLFNLSGNKTNFFFWSPHDIDLKNCIALYPNIYKKIYGLEATKINPSNKQKILDRTKEEFLEKQNKVKPIELETTKEAKPDNKDRTKEKIITIYNPYKDLSIQIKSLKYLKEKDKNE